MQCFVPLPVHLDLDRRFSRMIRAGYQNRNPFSLPIGANLMKVVTIRSSVKQVRFWLTQYLGIHNYRFSWSRENQPR